MEKRGVLYFFLVSLFLYNLIFSEIIVLPKNESFSIIDKILKKEEMNLNKKDEYRLVEVFIEEKKEKETKNLAKLQSKASGKITEEKGYSYYNDVRFIGEIKDKIELESLNNTLDNNSNINSKENLEFEKGVDNPKKSLVDVLPNLYVHDKAVINIDSNNNISIDAQSFEYADYLIKIAKKIFYRVLDFTPGMQIANGFIVSENGVISGTIGLYFKDDNFNVVFITPFKSPTMNGLVARAFSYIKIDETSEDFKLNFIIFSLKIYTSSLKAEANFKFDFFYKGKKYD